MVTLLVALAGLAACTAARWYLNRASRRESTHLGGFLRVTELWNRGAAFDLPIPKQALHAVSGAVLGLAWLLRRRSPLGAGLALGGGLSNLWERLRHGRVYDYLAFPKLPGIREYIYNLADLLIFLGGLLFLFRRKK